MEWDDRKVIFVFQAVLLMSPVIGYVGYCTGLVIRKYAQRWAVRRRLFSLCKEVW